MFTSVKIRSALTLSALTLSAGVMAAQAATVLSSVHYQRRITLVCGTASNDTICQGSFAAVADKHRLNLTRMSCFMFSPPGSEFSQGVVALRNATGGNPVVFQYMPSVRSASDGAHTLNQKIDMQVAATQHVDVLLAIVTNGAINGNHGECTATGTVDTLQ